MPKVLDVLTTEEHLEIANLRIQLLKSESFRKSRQIYKQIEQIIHNTEKRYYKEQMEKHAINQS